MYPGMVKFNECCLSELDNTDIETDNISLAGSVSMLDQYVGHARESLGVDSHVASSSCSSRLVALVLLLITVVCRLPLTQQCIYV